MVKKDEAFFREAEAKLKQKLAERRAALEDPKGDKAFRQLRKRLKRLQRRRRKLLLRKQRAMKLSKPESTQKSAS
jgi:hypothetical protein